MRRRHALLVICMSLVILKTKDASVISAQGACDIRQWSQAGRLFWASTCLVSVHGVARIAEVV